MTLNHVDLHVRDLDAAAAWFQRILQMRPGFKNDRIATFDFDSFTLIVDAAHDDAAATLGFTSDDCDRDFQTVVERGAIALERPTNREWGVRAAYFKGPGALKVEIEGPWSTS